MDGFSGYISKVMQQPGNHFNDIFPYQKSVVIGVAIGIAPVFYSRIVLIIIVIICQVTFKFDHQALQTEQLVSLIKFS